MAIPKSVVFLLFIVTCSTSVNAGQSQGINQMACIQKLMPCHTFLKGTVPPSDACCVPLKEVLASDEKCLCSVLTDPDVLKSFNLTHEVAPKLVKSCGGDADSSLCKSDSAASTAPVDKPSAATSISHAASFLSLAAIFSFVVFAFEGVPYVL